MGVHYRLNDKLGAACALATIVGSSNLCSLGTELRGLAHVLDRWLTQKLTRLLTMYGHVDFATEGN